MPNMSYCRFKNTYQALLDCSRHLIDNLGESEEIFRDMLIDLCREIADETRPEED